MLALNEFTSARFYDQTYKVDGCMFCEPEKELVVRETEHFWLIKDKYPICEGHLMVTSKTHFGCLGEIPRDWFSELEEVQEEVRRLYGNSPSISYEHGRAGHCTKIANSEVICHHFHLHFLPIDVDICSDLDRNFVKFNLYSLKGTVDFFERRGEYLLFQNSQKQTYIYSAKKGVESHLLRTLVCRALNVEERSDWESLGVNQ